MTIVTGQLEEEIYFSVCAELEEVAEVVTDFAYAGLKNICVHETVFDVDELKDLYKGKVKQSPGPKMICFKTSELVSNY